MRSVTAVTSISIKKKCLERSRLYNVNRILETYFTPEHSKSCFTLPVRWELNFQILLNVVSRFK